MAETAAKTESTNEATAPATPDPISKPLAGSISVTDSFGSMSELVAYDQARLAADRIAEVILAHLHSGDRVVIVEDRDLVAADSAYEQMRAIMDTFATEIDSAESALKSLPKLGSEPPALPEVDLSADEGVPKGKRTIPLDEFLSSEPKALFIAPALVAALAAKAIPIVISHVPTVAQVTGATTLVRSFADLAGMFKSNTTVKTPTITVDRLGFLLRLASQLASENDAKVIHVGISGLRFGTEARIEREFRELSIKRMELDGESRRVQAEGLESWTRRADGAAERAKRAWSTYEALLGDNDKADGAGRLRDYLLKTDKELESLQTEAYSKARVAVDTAKQVCTAWDDFTKVATSRGDDGKAVPPLMQAADRERVRTIRVDGSDQDVTHVLYVSVLGAKAEPNVKEGHLLVWGPSADYVAGVEVAYLLARADGTIVKADTTGLIGHLRYDLDDGKATDVRTVEISALRHRE